MKRRLELPTTEIRELYATGAFTMQQLAVCFKCSTSVIFRIVHNLGTDYYANKHADSMPSRRSYLK